MEATSSTSLNRHVIVLATVTVVFLPPSFVAVSGMQSLSNILSAHQDFWTLTLEQTVLNIQAFQKGDVSTTYKITTAILSLITYLVAILLVIIVARWHSLQKAIRSVAGHAFRTAKAKMSSYSRNAERASYNNSENSDSRASLPSVA